MPEEEEEPQNPPVDPNLPDEEPEEDGPGDPIPDDPIKPDA